MKGTLECESFEIGLSRKVAGMVEQNGIICSFQMMSKRSHFQPYIRSLFHSYIIAVKLHYSMSSIFSVQGCVVKMNQIHSLYAKKLTIQSRFLSWGVILTPTPRGYLPMSRDRYIQLSQLGGNATGTQWVKAGMPLHTRSAQTAPATKTCQVQNAYSAKRQRDVISQEGVRWDSQ